MDFATYAQTLRDIVSLGADDRLALDTEGTSLRPWGDNVLRGVAVAYEKDGRLQSAYLPLTHPQSENVPAGPLFEALQRTKALQLWWNYPYDSAVMERAGVPRAERYVDGMVVAWLMDENEPRALKKQGALRFGEDEAAEQAALKAIMKGETKADAYKRFRADGCSVAEAKEKAENERRPGRTWADLTADEISTYAAKDTELTYRLDAWQREQPEYRRIEPAIGRHLAVDGVVHRMTKLGVAVDRDRIVATRERYLREMDEIQAEFEGTCLDSPKQLATLLYETWSLPVVERTKSDQPSTSRDALELLEGSHPGLDRILRYRKAQKAVAGFFDTMLEESENSYDGRVHSSFNTTGTTTGRFTSSGPNLQQRPREDTTADADVFTAAPGYRLMSWDMSQCELRVAASIAHEESMVDVFSRADADIYQVTADRLACDERCVRNAKGQCLVHRQPFKTIVLASQYSIGPRKLTRKLKHGRFTECEYWAVAYEDRKALGLRRCGRCDVCGTSEILWDYWGSVPMLASTRDQLTRAAESLRYLPLAQPGRFRRFPTPAECRARKLAKWPRTYAGLNAVVQGSAAEVLKSWLLLMDDPITTLGARLVCTIHDSVTLEVLPGTEDAVGAVLQETLDASIPTGWVRIPLDRKEGM